MTRRTIIRAVGIFGVSLLALCGVFLLTLAYFSGVVATFEGHQIISCGMLVMAACCFWEAGGLTRDLFGA